MHKNVTKPLTREQEVHQQRNEQLRQRRKQDPIEEFCEYVQFLHSERAEMDYEELYYHQQDDADDDDEVLDEVDYWLWKEKRKHMFEVCNNILLKSKNLLIHLKPQNFG